MLSENYNDKFPRQLIQVNGCFIISSGTSPGSRGFSFYRLSSHYFAEVTTNRRKWKLNFLYTASQFTLIRISWHGDTGIILFFKPHFELILDDVKKYLFFYRIKFVCK